MLKEKIILSSFILLSSSIFAAEYQETALENKNAYETLVTHLPKTSWWAKKVEKEKFEIDRLSKLTQLNELARRILLTAIDSVVKFENNFPPCPGRSSEESRFLSNQEIKLLRSYFPIKNIPKHLKLQVDKAFEYAIEDFQKKIVADLERFKRAKTMPCENDVRIQIISRELDELNKRYQPVIKAIETLDSKKIFSSKLPEAITLDWFLKHRQRK